MNFIEYVKQIWKNGPGGGTPWSAARLNHMEDGIKNNNSMISELNNNLTNNICTNLLNPTLETSSQNGITCTNNNDGTYTLNGKNSIRTLITFLLAAGILLHKGHTYRLLGTPSINNAHLYIANKDFSFVMNDNGNGDTKTLSQDEKVNIFLEVHVNANIQNAIFKPMITENILATYNDFVSYTGNTGRLNADVALLKNNLNELLVSYYKSEPTLTLKKGTYWIFINKTQYSQSSIWAISSNQQPVAVANPSNEQMNMELNNDIMTITWKNASYAVVSVLKVY